MFEATEVRVFRTKYGREMNVPIPKKAHPTDSGHDIYNPAGFMLWPSFLGCKKVKTGIDVDIPLQVINVNGMRFGIDMTIEGRTCLQLNLVEPGPKVFDRTYRVEKGDPDGIIIGMKNESLIPRWVGKHARIAQLIFRPYLIAQTVEVENQDEIMRSTEAGFRGATRFGESDLQG